MDVRRRVYESLFGNLCHQLGLTYQRVAYKRSTEHVNDSSAYWSNAFEVKNQCIAWNDLLLEFHVVNLHEES